MFNLYVLNRMRRNGRASAPAERLGVRGETAAL
jgi:hypothetical protein